jgi:glycosyltransferase involved in cell wall biosynthesis
MDIMLGAFERLALEYPDLTFLAAGKTMEPRDEDWLEQWKRRTGLGQRVIHPGWVDRTEVVDYLDRMDIGLSANLPDLHSIRCWPANKVMYYMGRALPVVTTPNPLYKRFIEANKIGTVARDYTPEAYADAIRCLLEQPESTRSMGKRAYGLGRKYFSWERSSEDLLRFYSTLSGR